MVLLYVSHVVWIVMCIITIRDAFVSRVEPCGRTVWLNQCSLEKK